MKNSAADSDVRLQVAVVILAQQLQELEQARAGVDAVSVDVLLRELCVVAATAISAAHRTATSTSTGTRVVNCAAAATEAEVERERLAEALHAGSDVDEEGAV